MEFHPLYYIGYRMPTMSSYCKSCQATRNIWSSAKQRARNRGMDFNIELADVRLVPNYCPILGIKLERGNGDKDNSPSLDRIDNSKGYTKDNIIIVSMRANRIKNDATLEELEKIAEFYSKLKISVDKK